MCANETCFFAEVAWLTGNSAYRAAAGNGLSALVFYARELLDDSLAERIEDQAVAWQRRFSAEGRGEELFECNRDLADAREWVDQSDADLLEEYCSRVLFLGTTECVAAWDAIERGLDQRLQGLFRLGIWLDQAVHLRPAYLLLSDGLGEHTPLSFQEPGSQNSPTTIGTRLRSPHARPWVLPGLPLQPFPPPKIETWKLKLEQLWRLAEPPGALEEIDLRQLLRSNRTLAEIVEELLATAPTEAVAGMNCGPSHSEPGFDAAPNGFLQIEYCDTLRAIRRSGHDHVLIRGGKPWIILKLLIQAGERGRSADDLRDEAWANETAPARSCFHTAVTTLRGRLRTIQMNISRTGDHYRLTVA